MEIVNNGCDRITGLIKRETERKCDLEKRKEDRSRTLAEHERIGFFEKTFAEKRLEIEKALDSSSFVPLERLPAHFDNISKVTLDLQRYVAASNIFLRCYDIKVCHQNIQELTMRARELEERLLPKKKFGFKNRTKSKLGVKTTAPAKGNGRLGDEVDLPGGAASGANRDDTICGFRRRLNQELELKGAAILRQDVALRDLENCTVRLYGSPSTVHMSRLRNCLVLCGPVSTSVFVEGCTGCKLVVACQQMRLHGSTHVDVYLHVTSRAIVEDCSGISVAPYNWTYGGVRDDFAVAGLDPSVNNWTSVDDFNWLNAQVQSPNWSVSKDEERIVDWSGFPLPVG